MKPLDNKFKQIMNDCKSIATDNGLTVPKDTLEYIVTNEDMNDLHAKIFIPTLYDYWVDDTKTLRQKKQYSIMPHNPFETVINTRPPISFYNEHNPDWMNIMIFYHVIGHIDFFQENNFFKHTWDYDFKGRALSDKRLIRDLRSDHGRFVDYVIEFTRGIDNLIPINAEIDKDIEGEVRVKSKSDYYFSVFLQNEKNISKHEFFKERDNYKNFVENSNHPDPEEEYFSEISGRYPEFEAYYEKFKKKKKKKPRDLISYIKENSDFLNKEENQWMKKIMDVVRDTGVYFTPQAMTKIMNEGWATFWHQKLFIQDPKISSHEVDFAKSNAGVLSSAGGFNPYFLGVKLFEHIHDNADKGRFSVEYEKLKDQMLRQEFDLKTGKGLEEIFKVRKELCDTMFVDQFIDQDFMNQNKLYVTGSRINPMKGTMETYIKSRQAEDYKDMVRKHLLHPPHITFKKAHEALEKGELDEVLPGMHEALYLNHTFEGKSLVREYIPNTMIGLQYLWGKPVILDTYEIDMETTKDLIRDMQFHGEPLTEDFEPIFQKVRYICNEDRQITKHEKEGYI